MALGPDLLYVLLFSVLGGVLAARFRQPSVLGVLIAGAIVGPNALGLIHNKEVLELAIDIGAILLLFLVGIEFSVKKLLDMGLRALIVATIKLGTVFFIGHLVSLLFGLDALTALSIGVILSITSTVIFLKILEQKSMSDRKENTLLIAVLIIEDIFGVFALTFFSGLASHERITPIIIFTRLIISLALLSAVYFLMRKALRPLIEWLSRYSTDDTTTFIAISLCAGMAYIAHLTGLSAAVGAFLAGNIVSSLKNAETFEKAIHPFILAFTSLFFFSIGTAVSFQAIVSHIWLILALLLASLAAKFLSIVFSTYLFSEADGKGAVFSGLAMLSVGEFSLLIAKEANNIDLAVDLVSITAMIIFLSSLSMSMLVSHSGKAYSLLNAILPKGLRFDMREASRYIDSLTFAAVSNAITKRKISLEWKIIYRNIVGILFVAFIISIWYNTTQFRYLKTFFQIEYMPSVIVAIAIIILIFPTFSIVRNLRALIIDLLKSFIKLYPDQIANEKKVFRNIVLAVLLFASSIFIQIIVSVTGISARWSGTSIMLIITLLFVLLKSEKLMEAIMNKNRKLVERYNKRYNELIKNK